LLRVTAATVTLEVTAAKAAVTAAKAAVTVVKAKAISDFSINI